MRRMVAAAGVALGVHTLLFFLWDRYSQIVLSVGAVLTHGNDIADLPRLMIAGFIALGAVAVILGILLERLDHLLWRGDQQ
jgi:hypothetical protein